MGEVIFLGPIGLRLQLAERNGKQITSHSSLIRGAYWVKITAGKKTAAVLRRRRSRSLKPAFHGACFRRAAFSRATFCSAC